MRKRKLIIQQYQKKQSMKNFITTILLLGNLIFAQAQTVSNDGVTSTTHKKYMNKVVFATSKDPIKFGAENESAFATAFKLGDPIFFRVYMDNSLFNYANKLVPGQKREDINTKGGYKVKIYLDNVEMYAGNACEGISEFKATEQETFTTFKGALNNPSEKAIAERAFEQFIMKSEDKLTVGSHKVKIEFYPTVASSKEVVGNVIATGEFTLTVPANLFVAYDPAKCLPKAQMTDKSIEENILKAFKAQGWKEEPKEARIVESNWTIVRNELTGVILKRTIDAIVASTKEYKCQYQIFGFSQDYDGSKYLDAIYLDNIGDPKTISCKCLK